MKRSEETVQTEFTSVHASVDMSTQSDISQNNGSEETVATCSKSDFSFQTEADVQNLASFQGESMKKLSFENKSTTTRGGCGTYSVKELLTALSSSDITLQPRNSEIINNTLSAYCNFQDCNQAVQIYYERMLDLAEELTEKRKKLLGKEYRSKDFKEDLNIQYGSTSCQWLERHLLKESEFAKKYQFPEMSLHQSTNLSNPSTFNVTGSSATGTSKRKCEDKEKCIPKPLLTLSYHVNGITEIDNKVIILCCDEGLFAVNHEISLNLYCISNKPCAKKLMYAPKPQKSFLLAGSGTKFNLMACCSEFLESFTPRITNNLFFIPVFYTFDLFFNDFTINERRDILAASSHNKILLFHLSHNDEIVKQIVVQMDEPIYALCFVEDDSIGFFSRIFYSADVKTGKFYEMIQKKDSITLLENSGLDFTTSLSPVDIKCHRNKPDEVLILIGKAAMTVDLPSRKMKYSFLSFFQTPINAIRYGDILMTIFDHWIEFIDLSNQAAYDLTTINSAVLYRVYVGNIVSAIGPDMSGRYTFLIVRSDDNYNIHVLQSQNIVMMLRKSLGRDPVVGVRV